MEMILKPQSQIARKRSPLSIIKFILLSLFVAMAITIIAVAFIKPKCNQTALFNYQFLVGSTSKFSKKIEYFRKNDLPQLTKIIYFDNIRNLIFPSSLYRKSSSHEDLQFDPYAANLSEIDSTVRNIILDFFSADLREYSVVFVDSLNSVAHLVGGSYKWSNKTNYYYLENSGASSIEMQKFAKEGGSQCKILKDVDIPKRTQNEDQNEDQQIQKNVIFDFIEIPLQDNFFGMVLPSSKQLSLISNSINGFSSGENINIKPYITFADATNYFPAHRLNITRTPFHIISVDFGQMFGTTNYHAMIIRKSVLKIFHRSYRGSASLHYILPSLLTTRSNKRTALGFEDAQIPPTVLKKIYFGFDFLKTLGVENILTHVKRLQAKLYFELKELRYDNSRHVVEIYGEEKFLNGNSITFNILTKQGQVVPYKEFVAKAHSQNVFLSGGCFDNPSACISILNTVRNNHGNVSIINEIDKGAVKVVINWMTLDSDIKKFVGFIKHNYLGSQGV